MPKDKSTKRESASSGRITDSRFANFETDPRFQLPSKKNIKTKIDKRFSRVLKDADFVATAKVDRYGRKLKTDTKKKALQRLYEEEDEEGQEDDDLKNAEVEDDDIVRRELEEADAKYDPAREGGFSSSEDDSDSEDESESEEEPEQDDEVEESRPGIRLRREKQEVEVGEVTNRFAVVNMDWDHIKSVDLMALFSSFVPAGGRIEKVAIYPSEFGKSRMQREEVEGPPREIFKKGKGSDDDEDEDDSESDSEDDDDGTEASDEEVKKELLQEGTDQDFDSDALRTYQLDRLRYYYAVVVCSDTSTAHKIYEATDGSEYLSSSNFLDLRFIPDDVTFDDEPRDECDSVPPGYKPVEFVTDALQHSKVKLTWDMHPEEVSRKESIKKAFTGSRADIAENDLRAYLASDTESDEEDEVVAAAGDEDGEEAPLSKKELARRKMRAALGLSDEPAPKPSKSGPVGEMQITFTPALSGKPEKKEPEEETTIEKYKRKEKERKEKKRAKALAKREGLDPDAVQEEPAEEAAAEDDLGFDDPFFTSEPVQPSKSAMRKEERLKKRAAREREEAENAAQKAQLELLMADENGGGAHLEHFDMKEIVRAEKQKSKRKKGKKGAAAEDQGGLQEDFKMDVEDSRFKAVFENHEFAIDPSNPKFKATQGMKKLLEEGRKKRKAAPEERDQGSSKKVKADGDLGELSSLVDAALAVPEPEPEVCIVWPLHIDKYTGEEPALPFTVDAAWPAVAHVCRAARHAVFTSGAVQLRHSPNAGFAVPYRHFNPAIDTLYWGEHQSGAMRRFLSQPENASFARSLRHLAVELGIFYPPADLADLILHRAVNLRTLSIVLPSAMGNASGWAAFLPPARRCKLRNISDATAKEIMVTEGFLLKHFEGRPMPLLDYFGACRRIMDYVGTCRRVMDSPVRSVHDDGFSGLEIKAKTFVEYTHQGQWIEVCKDRLLYVGHPRGLNDPGAAAPRPRRVPVDKRKNPEEYRVLDDDSAWWSAEEFKLTETD